VLTDDTGGLWLDQEALAQLRLRVPASAPRLVQGRSYYSVQSIPGASVTTDAQAQVAHITAPASAFVATRRSLPTDGAAALTTASPGAFANYQLSGLRVGRENSYGGTGELGLFAAPGVLTNSALYRDLSGDGRLVRLETTFTHDMQGRLESLVLGDTLSDAGSWGNVVRFAGVRWGTNFALRPDLLTTPLLSAAGAAVVPSTVEVFVNNQQVSSQQLPPGPFIIERLPAVTGTGQVSVIVRDALGREQTITQPFYSSAALLSPGLSQYAIDLGAIRQNYALSSADYGSGLAVADYHRGLTGNLTVSGHAEYLAHGARAAGFSLARALGTYGIVNVTAAGGGAGQGTGYLGGLGFEHLGGRVSFTASSLSASRDFRQVGDTSGFTLPFRQRDLLQTGVSLPRASSLALALVRESFYDRPTQQTLSLSYSLVFGDRGALSLSASHTQAQQAQNSFYLSYTIALSARRSASLATIGGSGQGPGGDDLYATFLQNLPVGPGTGYRLAASARGNYDADWQRQFAGGALDLEAARNQGVSGQSALWSGGATWIGGELRTTRTVNDSFALVDLDGIPDVPVYIDHQLVTHTDAQGYAMLHQLLPYQANRIDIVPTELPLDTQINAQTLTVEPPYRSGIVVHFPVERTHGGSFRLVDEHGVPIPAGAVVRFQGRDFPVAFDGVAYVVGYDHGTAGVASWEDRRCVFRLPPPPPDDPLPDVGTIPCH
jgi:outer membrane usher protein